MSINNIKQKKRHVHLKEIKYSTQSLSLEQHDVSKKSP